MRSLFSLLIWYALLYGLQAVNLDRPLNPQGPLGITLDYSLVTTWPKPFNPKANDPRAYMWSSRLTFRQDVGGITVGQLWQLALDAYQEMQVDFDQYEIVEKQKNKDMPSAMGVLAWGNQLIFASSQKGPSYSYGNRGTPVRESLDKCQIVWRDTGPIDPNKPHKSMGRCAETSAAQLYYLANTTPLESVGARVGTVVLRRSGSAEPTDPCGDPARVRQIPL